MEANQKIEPIVEETKMEEKSKPSIKKILLFSIVGVLIFLALAKIFFESFVYIIAIPIFVLLIIVGGKYIIAFSLFIFKIVGSLIAILFTLGILIKIVS